MNVKRLDGQLLNFWVAKSAGLQLVGEDPGPDSTHDTNSGFWHPHTYDPSHDWSHAGSVIAEEWYRIEDTLLEWFGPEWSQVPAISKDPLKWFLRAYVATQFGDEVEDVSSAGSCKLRNTDSTPVPATPSVKPRSWMPHWLRQLND